MVITSAVRAADKDEEAAQRESGEAGEAGRR